MFCSEWQHTAKGSNALRGTLRDYASQNTCLSSRTKVRDLLPYALFVGDSSRKSLSEWHYAVRPSTLGGRFFLPTVVRMTLSVIPNRGHRPSVRNLWQQTHLAWDSSTLRASEWHCGWNEILHFTAFRSEWQVCVIPNEYEESPAFYQLRFFTPLMLHSEWHTAKSYNILREILQGKAFQNDITVISNVGERSRTKRTIRQEILRCFAPQNDMCRKGVNTLQGILHFAYASFRMTMLRNFFPAAKKLPRKVARLLSGFPAFRFSRRRGLRNSLRSNSPRPFSVFSLAPGSPIKAGMSSTYETGTCAVE